MACLADSRTEHTATLQLKGSKPSFKWLADPGQLIDGAILKGAWEWHTTWAAERLVKPGMHVVDVGANIGYYMVLFWHLVGATGKVVGFEPMYEPRDIAKQNCVLNGFDPAVYDIALSDEDGQETKLFNYSWPPDRVAQQACQFSTRRLDSMLAEAILPESEDRIDIIKIDVDGYEQRVIAGAESTLTKYHPVLILEVCDYTLRAAAAQRGVLHERGEAAKNLLLSLLGLGYRFWREEDFSPAPDVDAILASFDLVKSGINLICSQRDLLC